MCRKNTLVKIELPFKILPTIPPSRNGQPFLWKTNLKKNFCNIQKRGVYI